MDDHHVRSGGMSPRPSWTPLSKAFSDQMTKATKVVDSDEAQAKFDHWIAEGIPVSLIGSYVDQGRIVVRIGVDAPITNALLSKLPKEMGGFPVEVDQMARPHFQ